jgi:RNA methyltransferase, TrmH family
MTDGRGRERRAAHERELLRICGLAAVRAVFARDPGRVERLFFEDGTKGLVGPFCRTLARARKPYRQVDKAELARIAGTILHGGIVAIARPRPPLNFDAQTARQWAADGKPLLILDGVSNPHNLGAIVRSAAFFGLERIVISDRPEQAVPSDASFRVAEGGFEYLNLFRAPLPDALDELRPVYRIIGTALGSRATLDRRAADRPVALVFGNEEMGLDPAMIAACDEVVTIPGSGRVQSLNVAAAAAILIYLLTCS